MSRIVIDENDALGALVPLMSEQAITVNASRLLEVRPEGGGWRVLPRPNMVGVVRIGEVEVEVRPKAHFQSVLFMLGYASDPGIQPDDVEAQADSDVWPAIAEWCARLTERALLAGVLQGYRSIHESLPLVRGRIDFATQLATRPHDLIPLALQFDDFTTDIYENQLLRSALRRASWLPRLSSDLRGRLRHLDRRLETVGILSRHRAGDWQPNRANTRYIPALRFADLLLQGVGLDAPGGASNSFSFIIDLAKVFEEFLVAAVSESCEHLLVNARHHPGMHLDQAARLAIAPDIGLFEGNQMVAVIDAKYKLSNPVSDLYQMLAYCTVTGLARGWLVYAGSYSESPRPRHHRIAGSQVTITQWPLDSASPPRELLEQVTSIVSSILAARTDAADLHD